MELPLPLSIYWDLPPEPADPAAWREACAGVIACRPLMLHLRHPGEVIGAATSDLLMQLGKTRIAVELTVPASAFPGALALEGVKTLLLLAEHPDQAVLLPAALEGKGETGVSFPVHEGNWRSIPRLVSLCRERGISRLVLPMQRRYRGEAPFLLGREEQMLLSREIVAAGGLEGLRLTVHDPFLWRACYPGVPFPQGGCQAGNTMLAIAPDGLVYPCPTLPLCVGDLAVAPLREIALSQAKKEARALVLVSPAGCRGCADLASCLGGCRGRALTLSETLDQADPACR